MWHGVVLDLEEDVVERGEAVVVGVGHGESSALVVYLDASRAHRDGSGILLIAVAHASRGILPRVALAMAAGSLLAVAWASVGAAQGASPPSIQAELTANQQKWAENGADDYRYRMQRSCFCPPEITTPGIVVVRGDAITEVSRVDGFGSLDPAPYLSVDGLFAVIQDAIDQGADEISVSWDPLLGYPTDIYVDSIIPAVDDEIAYSARDLVLGTGYEARQAALDDALETWNAAGIAHYRFRMQRSCFCPAEITAPGLVEVLDDEIVSVVDPNTASPLAPENYLTVSGLFAVAQAAIDFEAWQFSAAYDPVLGYPTEIFTDAEEFLADDTTAYAASELVDLPEPRALRLELVAGVALFLLHRRGGFVARVIDGPSAAARAPHPHGRSERAERREARCDRRRLRHGRAAGTRRWALVAPVRARRGGTDAERARLRVRHQRAVGVAEVEVVAMTAASDVVEVGPARRRSSARRAPASAARTRHRARPRRPAARPCRRSSSTPRRSTPGAASGIPRRSRGLRRRSTRSRPPSSRSRRSPPRRPIEQQPAVAVGLG